MIREPEDVSNRICSFDLCQLGHPEERIVSQTTHTPSPSVAASSVVTIAIRKSCNPDGIGLSHYVLMDKKAAK